LIALISNAHLMFSFSSIWQRSKPRTSVAQVGRADTALKRPEVIRDKP
jgi:hypothetical protein